MSGILWPCCLPNKFEIASLALAMTAALMPFFALFASWRETGLALALTLDIYQLDIHLLDIRS